MRNGSLRFNQLISVDRPISIRPSDSTKEHP